MALARRNGQRFASTVWPGFVDAMTALLLVLMFVLTIFMVVQTVLRDTLSTKEHELSALSAQVAELAGALSLRVAEVDALNSDLAEARDKAEVQRQLIASLTGQLESREAELDAAGQKITAFEAQVAALLSQQEADRAEISELRLDVADMEELRAKLKASGDELAAMTLALEAARQRAEETLTLLAAAEAAKQDLSTQLAEQLSAAEREAALNATAQKALADQAEISDENARKVALLNEQIAALRTQLAELQGVLDAAAARDAEAKVQVEALGSQLNAALAQVAAEQKRRAEAEAARARELERYRSEFFGRLSEILAGREGVQVVGDRFVFSSEVLFASGSADLSDGGRAQIARVTTLLQELAAEIPREIDWIIRVDGHTDDQPLLGSAQFRDNWELSQARALSVVRYMTNDLGFPPQRLAAAGFGEFRPIVAGDSAEARAQNRRIELKLTER